MQLLIHALNLSLLLIISFDKRDRILSRMATVKEIKNVRWNTKILCVDVLGWLSIYLVRVVTMLVFPLRFDSDVCVNKIFKFPMGTYCPHALHMWLIRGLKLHLSGGHFCNSWAPFCVYATYLKIGYLLISSTHWNGNVICKIFAAGCTGCYGANDEDFVKIAFLFQCGYPIFKWVAYPVQKFHWCGHGQWFTVIPV